MERKFKSIICIILILSLLATTLTSCSGKIADALSPFNVLGASEDIYYTTPNQSVTVSVNVKNTKNYEIKSLTVNGIKMSVDELIISNENGLTKVSFILGSGSEGGVFDFSIDNVEYVKGSKVKSLDIKDEGFRLGVRVDNMVSATLISKSIDVINQDSASFEVEISDPYSLVEKFGGKFQATLYSNKSTSDSTSTPDDFVFVTPDDFVVTPDLSDSTTEIKFNTSTMVDGSVAVKYTAVASSLELVKAYDASVGKNTFTFSDLDPELSYKFVISAQYDDLTGDASLILSTGSEYNFNYTILDSTNSKYNVHNHSICNVSFNMDGFYINADNKPENADDAIREALSVYTDNYDKEFSGKPEKYDVLSYCYYATDADGNIFFTDKMNYQKSTSLSLGLANLEGLNKAISDKILALDGDISDYVYSTSDANVVGKGDVISLSYTKTWAENETCYSETKYNYYFIVGDNNKLAEALIGKRVGVTLDEFKITENDNEYFYTDVKVESIIKDNSTVKVNDGDVAYITYTITFDPTPWYDADAKEYKLPEGYSPSNINAEGMYKATVSYEKNVITADPEYATAEERTFLAQLVGKSVGFTSSSITVRNVEIGDRTVEVKYSNIKINWVSNSNTEGFTVTYTPYKDELKEDKSNKKEETNVYGEKITLNGVELTYHVFPIYYTAIPDIDAEVILDNFIDVISNKYDDGRYVLDVLNDSGYTYEGKSVSALMDELVALYYSVDKESVIRKYESAEKALLTAQKNLAKYNNISESELTALVEKMNYTHAEFLNQKSIMDAMDNAFEEKISEILSCTKNGAPIEDEIVRDFKEYVDFLLNR